MRPNTSSGWRPDRSVPRRVDQQTSPQAADGVRLGGAVGAFGSGRLTDRWGANRTLFLAIGLLAVTLAALAVWSSRPLTFVVMALNGSAAWAVAAPNNHRLTEFVPHLPSVVISFNSSGIYLGQAIGAGLGGVLLSSISATQLCYVGAGIAVLAAALHLLIVSKPATPLAPYEVARTRDRAMTTSRP